MNKATRIITACFGAIISIAGIEHGIGEILQGSVPPESILFLSWPNSEFFRVVSGEPAMTILPNLLMSGILTIFFSLAYLLWAVFFAQRKHGGLVLVSLAIIMLLVGGGIFPPILGILIGIIGTRINLPFTWWRIRCPVKLRNFFGKMWPQFLVISLIAWLALFPGLNLLDYSFGVENPILTILVILFAFGSMLGAIISGFAFDSQRNVIGD